MKTDKENWEEIKWQASNDFSNKFHDELHPYRHIINDVFLAGVAFAQVNLSKIPEVKELIEAVLFTCHMFTGTSDPHTPRELLYKMFEEVYEKNLPLNNKWYDALQKLEG